MRFNEFKEVDTINSLAKGEEIAGPFIYTVKKGDSLWNIAKKHKDLGFSYQELIASNPQIKDPDLIRPGEKITIPVKDTSTSKVLPPDIERGRPTMKDDPRLKPDAGKPTEPKDDGSFDRAEKKRFGWDQPPKTEPPKTEPPKTEPPTPNVDSTAGAGRGKINPGPVGKGIYRIANVDSAYRVFNFFKNNGFTDAQAAAFVGNAYHESAGLNPKVLGDYHLGVPTSGGLFQWHNTRWLKLEIFAKRKGKSWKDFDLQLDFTMHELEGPYKNVVTALNQEKNKNDVKSATFVVMDLYENPKKATAAFESRLGYAKTALEAFGTTTAKAPAK
jgi:spore coat assembly protein SafA